MNKKDILNLLFNLEQAIITHDFDNLWSENLNFIECWTRQNCKKKSCPAYGRLKVRCWHIPNTFCSKIDHQGEFNHVFHCNECVVFKDSMPNEDIRVREIINNIVFALKKFEPAAINSIRIKQNLDTISKHYKLTTREHGILLLLLEKLSRKEISKNLNISVETVKMHTRNLYKKLNISSRKDILKELTEFCDNNGY